jgi:hypothetical protein
MLISSKIIDRVIKHKGFKTDLKLAEYWCITPTTVTNWRKRNSIPFEKIITFCKDEGISLDYIFTGEGEMIRKPEIEGVVAEDSPIYNKEEKITEDGYDHILKDKLIKTQDELIDQLKNRLAETEEKLKASEELADKIRTETENENSHRGDILKKKAM